MKQKECLLAGLLLLPLTAMAALEASDLRVESLRSPLGIDTQTPAFSWLLNSDERDCTQVSYAIIVTKADGTQVWSSGTVFSYQHTGIAYAGSALESCSAYNWAVTLTDNRGRTATRTSSFETAFMDASEWTSKWIDTNIAAGRNGIVSVTYGMTETQVIMGSGDYDLMLGEGNVITAADGEIIWLPEHGVDELITDSFQFEAGTVYDMCGIPIYRKNPNRVYIAKGKKYVSH